LPFWCDWGYDWAERCYRLDGAWLGVGGGEPDKVWRSALRFFDVCDSVRSDRRDG
jgi:hypothetical protein